MRSGEKKRSAQPFARKHYTDLYMIKHAREILAVISIIIAPELLGVFCKRDSKGVDIHLVFARETATTTPRRFYCLTLRASTWGFSFAFISFLFSSPTQWSAIDIVPSCEIRTMANVCRFGRFYELLVPRVRPWYRHSLRCISFSSRILDPRYLHSRVYFALKELSARLILAVSRPPTSFPYPRWWNLSCYCAVKTKWNYRIFSRTLRRPGRAREREKELRLKLEIRRCCRCRSQYVFLPPRDAISAYASHEFRLRRDDDLRRARLF